MNTLLKGVVGSTAYGLARPGSDVDRLAVHAIDTGTLFTLASRPADTITSKDPDIASHELHKALSLMFGCNPTVMEILWIDDWEEMNQFGEELVDMRTDFLCQGRVRDAYLGFATQQFKRLEIRGRFQGSLDTRREKHARHLLRMVEQGVHLYRTGRLKVRVDNPDYLHGAAKTIADSPAGIEIAKEVLAQAEEDFDAAISPLPLATSTEHAEDLIQRVRKHYWK
ncbi:nucleotidyltransferase [Rhodococcus hoagii]|uniref:Nucleotidyltransferase n=1 Tax=Rhodococcus hoagii TaxID=43767 RepID=A0A9Q4ZIS7_RHOHA|nr:nucleotidyltransferase [Prescottella equi]NKT77305.1 nucleotidyltransferase [Prescottella equi]NKZ81092.1 nucleotidyltransferase [Prescottella equi]